MLHDQKHESICEAQQLWMTRSNVILKLLLRLVIIQASPTNSISSNKMQSENQNLLEGNESEEKSTKIQQCSASSEQGAWSGTSPPQELIQSHASTDGKDQSEAQSRQQGSLEPSEESKPEVSDLLDPIEELLKNNNALPLTAVIEHINIDRPIEQKPLICILAAKFIPLSDVLQSKEPIDLSHLHDSDLRTPLHYAIEADDVKSAAWCLEHRNPNKADSFGNTPILDAIRLGRKRCFLLCLKNKQMYDNRAPVVAAMYNRHWELKFLHSMGHEIMTARDDENRNAFERSLEYCSFQSAEFLLRTNPELDIQEAARRQLTDSRGLINTLKRVKREASLSSQYSTIVYPILLLLLIWYCAIAKTEVFIINKGGASDVKSSDSLPYSQTGPFLLVLIVLLSALYVLTFIFGSVCSGIPSFQQPTPIRELLNEPSYFTLQDICPSCRRFTDFQSMHCYQSGCCVQKFHFYGFTCVHKGNEVFWILTEVAWMYLAWLLRRHFQLWCLAEFLELAAAEGWWIIQTISTFQILCEKGAWTVLLWTVFLEFLFLYQVLYCCSLGGMMCMRRKFPEVIDSSKFEHLYYVDKKDDKHYMNKEKRVFSRGLLGGAIRSVRNFLFYFFVQN